MLRNCFLPFQIPNCLPFQTCGEIMYQNIDEFLISCTLCKIKMFAFDEFVLHIKNAHLEELVNGAAANVSTKNAKCVETVTEAFEEQVNYNYQHIMKSEDNEAENTFDYNESQDLYDDDPHYFASDNDQLANGDEEYVFSDEYDAPDEEEYSIMKKARKPKEYSCAVCGKKYAEERRLQMHLKILHLREKPFKCTDCEEIFAEQRSLQNHIRDKHTGHDCPICQKNYSSGRNLKRHMQIHIETKEFICHEQNCGKAFASKGLLRDHQRCHRKEIYICEQCGYKCRQRDSLVVHKRSHTGEKPFACKQCDSRFASKPLLKEHMAAHETERKHVCDICGKSFNRPKALYHHKHLHLGVKKFVCKMCGSAYAQAAGLSAHMRKHRDEMSGITKEVPLTKSNASIINTFYNF